jgi:glucose/arabinose dehydrogenase
LSGEALIHVQISGDQAGKADEWAMGKRIRAADQGPDGAVYLLVDGPGARLLRLTPRK